MRQWALDLFGPKGSHPNLPLQRAALLQSKAGGMSTILSGTCCLPVNRGLARGVSSYAVELWPLSPTQEFTISSLTREITPPSSFWIRPPGSLWESVSLPSTLSWLWQPHLGKQCWYLQDSFPNSRFLFGSWGPHSVCFFPFFWLLLWIDSRNLHFHWWHNKALVESTVNWDSEALGLSRLCHYHCKFRWALNFPGLQFLLP